MYVTCLATDYDGTLAADGLVDSRTIESLERLRKSGRKTVLVTGRELPDLLRCFSRLDLFDRVVAENGALLYAPSTKKETPLAPPPPALFVDRLRALGVEPLSVGRAIVATWTPREKEVLQAIRDFGLELQIVFNKGAVMVLPPGVNKASGLKAALGDLGLSPHNVVGVGDAENDHAFLAFSGCAVAVANALPMLKAAADHVTDAARGAGVVELIDALLDQDARAFAGFGRRERIAAGETESGDEIKLYPADGGVLIAGASGGGKSNLATALFERFLDRGFQVCIFDPEGDYTRFRAVSLGDGKTPPQLSEAVKVLEGPDDSLVLNLLGAPFAERPVVFAQFMSAIGELRARTGRPHWILVDEAHHLLPAERHANALALPKELPGAIFVTVDPASMAPAALECVNDVFAVGPQAGETLAAFCAAAGLPRVETSRKPRKRQALHWRRDAGASARIVALVRPAEKAERHTRKYAEGDLGEDKSFFFRGPENALKLRAQNLTIFLQMAEGVDDETWLHHLRAGDYSNWARCAIKDDDLADEIAAVEQESELNAHASRARIRETIERRYTAPATQAKSTS